MTCYGNPATVVLLAEDEPAIRKLVEGLLCAAGYRVMVAVDGQDALYRARQHPGAIHLLLTNVKMPKLNGVDLAQQLRLERPEIKVLIMSGKTSGELDSLMKQPDFIAKPFLPKALLDKIADVLANPHESEPEFI
jgi:DNA-binding response OmpR family regulator